MDNEKILEVKNMKTYFYMTDGVVKAVDDVSFSLNKGQTLGIVGESGCGKSVTSLSVMRLIQQPPGKIVEGEILYHGKDLLKLPMRQIRKIRGANISMIFQEPMTSLNPVFQVGDQIAETLTLHQGLKSYSWRDWFTRTKRIDTPAWRRAIEMLKLVGIPDPERRVLSYPHEMSGGMRQRVMIAMAMACNPEILIADEATTALDVTIQAQILELMKDLRRRFGMAIILITHNLAVVAEMVDEIAVMYSGKIVEYAEAKNYAKAIERYNRVTELDPQYADAYFNLGYIYAVTKKWNKAESMYEQVVKLAPPYLDEALFNLAMVQKRLGKRDACIENLKKAVIVNPKNNLAKKYLKKMTGK